MLGFGRALRAALVGLAAALFALVLAAPRLRAEPETRGAGRIAFTFGESSADRPAQLVVMDADGKNRRPLPPYGVYGLSWSPNGRFIALGGPNISTIDVDDPGTWRVVVRNGRNPDWSPNGRSIAFERGDDIWVFNLNDHRQRRLVRNGRSPGWSPDSRKLAFARGPLYSDSSPEGPDLWVLDVAGKREKRLVRNGEAADWSPGGRRIAFDRCRTQSGYFDCSIYVMRSDGTKQRRLFKGQDPAWSPNGEELAFIGDAGRRNDAVIRARLDGSGRRVLFGEKPYCGCFAIDWARPGPR